MFQINTKAVSSPDFMKIKFWIIVITMLSTLMISGCSDKEEIVINSPEDAVNKLIQGNSEYLNSAYNLADTSRRAREGTAENGQAPYAVVLTCADSRVPPEHIFSAGIGDLFVIRVAGNVVSEFELGSIEYGVGHLGAKVVLVMGHTNCGAVAAAIDGHAEGYVVNIIEEIQSCVSDGNDAAEAENNNIAHSADKILESALIRELVDSDKLIVAQAKYNIETGQVDFFDQE